MYKRVFCKFVIDFDALKTRSNKATQKGNNKPIIESEGSVKLCIFDYQFLPVGRGIGALGKINKTMSAFYKSKRSDRKKHVSHQNVSIL